MCHATVLFFTLSVVSLGYYELVICILLYPSYLLDKIRQANDPMLWICLCFCSLFFLLLFCSSVGWSRGIPAGFGGWIIRLIERESPSRAVQSSFGLRRIVPAGLVSRPVIQPVSRDTFRKHGTKNLTRWGCRWDCRWGWRKVHASTARPNHSLIIIRRHR